MSGFGMRTGPAQGFDFQSRRLGPAQHLARLAGGFLAQAMIDGDDDAAAGGAFSSPSRASRCISAMESPPPETATAPGQGAPAAMSPSIAAAKCASRDSAADGFAGVRALAEDGGRSVRIFRRERGKSGATFLLLAGGDQRLAELEHAIGRARAEVGYFLITSAKARAALP